MFSMRKQIKNYGNTHVVVLSSEDMKVYGLEDNEIIDFDIIKVKIKKSKEVNNGRTIIK